MHVRGPGGGAGDVFKEEGAMISGRYCGRRPDINSPPSHHPPSKPPPRKIAQTNGVGGSGRDLFATVGPRPE
eukprot:1411191-Pyramimonas_sp.AAC.1